jgi:uncharacterized protein
MSLPTPTSDSRAVVTGASSGIGAALADELAARGYSLIIVARRAELLNALASRLSSEHGVQVEVRAVDLSDPAARAPLAAELAERDISVLCNNAGVATFGPVAELDHDVERDLVQLLARRSGGILITGSAAGNLPVPNNATYAASKAFVNSFAESLRGELSGTGVNVTLLAPGPVRTVTPDPADASIVDKVLPDSLWVTSESVAKDSLDALGRNKMRVVPGIVSKVMSVGGGYAPRALSAPIIGKLYRKFGEGS